MCITSSLPTCPLREEKSFSQRVFSIYTDIRKLQDKAKTSYTLSTRRLRFGYEQQFARSTLRTCFGMIREEHAVERELQLCGYFCIITSEKMSASQALTIRNRIRCSKHWQTVCGWNCRKR